MRRHDDDATLPRREVAHDFHRQIARLGVERCGGLVRDNEVRQAYERAGYRYSLLLPVGQAGGEVAPTIPQPQGRKHGMSARTFGTLLRLGKHVQASLDILVENQHLHKVMLLKNKSNAAAQI